MKQRSTSLINDLRLLRSNFKSFGCITQSFIVVVFVLIVILTVSLVTQTPAPNIILEQQEANLSAFSVAWNSSGTRLLSSNEVGQIDVWDSASWQRLSRIQAHNDSIQAISWSPNQKYVASVGFDWNMKIWDAETFTLLNSATIIPEASQLISWNSASDRITNGGLGLDALRQVWSLSPFTNIADFESRQSPVALDPTFTKAAYIDRRSILHIEAISPSPQTKMLSLSEPILHAVWSPTGDKIAGIVNDNRIVVWDASSASPIAEWQGYSDEITAIMWDDQGSRLASVSVDRTIRIWEIASERATLVMNAPPDVYLVTRQDYLKWNSARNILVAVGSSSPSDYPSILTIWDTANGEVFKQYNFEKTIFALDLDPTASYLAVTGTFGLKVLDIQH